MNILKSGTSWQYRAGFEEEIIKKLNEHFING
jgi:hypothetical protein